MTQQLSLAYIQNVRLPTEKAHGYQMMKTCESLAQLGLKIDLIVADRENPLAAQDPFLYYGVEHLFEIERLPVIDWILRVPKWLWKIAFVLERMSFKHQVARILPRLNEADILYTRDPAVAEVLVKSSKPVVVELHDDPRSNLKRWKGFKNRVAAWVVISRALESLLQEEGIQADRICYAPDGFDEKEFENLLTKQAARVKLGIPDDLTLFVYTGQLFPWKGLDDLAPAFSEVPEGALLAIVGGDDADRARIAEKAGEKLERTKFYPRVSHAEALDWLAAADAAILPTSAKFEIGRRFTSPLKLFEYLAAGLPIIASDVPSSRDILTENEAIFFTHDDSKSFIYALERLMWLEDSTRTCMSNSARERGVAYTWSARSSSISMYIHNILNTMPLESIFLPLRSSAIGWCKKHIHLLSLVVATLLIATIPIVAAVFSVGTTWSGVLPSSDNYYYARIHEIKDSHPFLGNPYFYEHRNETSPAFFLADWIASIPYLIGIPLAATVVFNHFFWSMINVLLFYLFLRIIGLPKFWSAIGALLVYIMAFVLIVRPVSMQVVYPAFTILALAAVRWLQSPLERKRTIIFSFAIALSVYMYTYLAQVGIAFAGILIALFFLQKKWNAVKSLVFILLGAFILSLPFAWYAFRQVTHPFYWESMVRIGLVNTRLPTFNAFTILWWVAVCLGLLYVSRHNETSKECDKHTVLFFVIAGIALVAVSFSNVITNKELETAEHIERFVIIWFGWGLVYAFSRFANQIRSSSFGRGIRSAIYACLIVLSCVGAYFYMCAAGLLCLFSTNITESMAALRDDQSEARALAWLEQHEAESKVIWAPFNSSINDNIEINTKHYTLFSMGGILHLVSDKEVEERFLTAGYLYKFTIEDIENNFKLFAGAGNAVHAYKTHNRGVLVCRLLQVERFGGHCGELTDAISYKGVDYFQRLYQQYAEEIRPNITDKLKKFHVAYIVTDAKIPGQESVSDITGIEKVYADERFIIYKLP